MSYKQTKKAPQNKVRKTYCIPDDLIKGQRFIEIVNRVGNETELTNRDRYIYGYSLLRVQRNLEALISLWPLVAKGYKKLYEDCAIIATNVFADAEQLSSIHLSDCALYTLFCAGENLVPQSVTCPIIKQRLFNKLWQEERFEKLESLLKSSKEKFSGILIENLSKLDFFQPYRKLIGNIPAFVGHVLTGGACLIVRESIYHGDIENEIRLLANELKCLFYQLKSKSQSLGWSRILFENFVDYEANILIHLLKMVIKNNDIHFDIIPTPSYLMYYDATTKRVSEKFLPWLAAENKELFEAYNPDTYHMVLWLFCGEKTPHNSKILKSIHKSSLNPYLLLAIMLRSISMKKESLGNLVQLSDFANVNQTTNVFKEVVIQAIKSLLDNQSNIKLPTVFWRTVVEFYPVLQDSYCKDVLTMQLIEKLKEEYSNKLNLDFASLKNSAQQIEVHNLANQADILCARQQVCIEFLLNLKDEEKSEKIVQNIKNEPALYEHLTLVADCCLLICAVLSIQFFQHIKSIIQDDKLNKFISVRELVDYEFDCTCMSCQERIYRYEIPNLAKELSLPIVSIPDAHSYVFTQPLSNPLIPKPSILLQTDPFKILNVSLTDSKQIIMQKVMRLIQQSPEQMATYRQAQSDLFNPAQRFLHQYLRFLNHKNNNIDTNVQHTLPLTNSALHEIPLRREFLDEDW